MDDLLDDSSVEFIQAIFESHAGGTRRPARWPCSSRGRPLLRAHRRPRREHRRAGPVHGHRLAARAHRRGPPGRARASWRRTTDAARARDDARRWSRLAARRRASAARVVARPSVALVRSDRRPSTGRATRGRAAPNAALAVDRAVGAPPTGPSWRRPRSTRAHAAGRARRAARRRGRRGRRRARSCCATRAAEHFVGARHADALVDEAVAEHVTLGQPRAQPDASSSSCTARRRARSSCARCRCSVTPGDAAVRAMLPSSRSRTSPSGSGSKSMRTDFVANISHELRTPVGGARAAGRDARRTRTTRTSSTGWPSKHGRRGAPRVAHHRRPARAVAARARGRPPGRGRASAS